MHITQHADTRMTRVRAVPFDALDTTAHNKLDDLYNQVVEMLDEKYYFNTGEQKVASKK